MFHGVFALFPALKSRRYIFSLPKKRVNTAQMTSSSHTAAALTGSRSKPAAHSGSFTAPVPATIKNTAPTAAISTNADAHKISISVRFLAVFYEVLKWRDLFLGEGVVYFPRCIPTFLQGRKVGKRTRLFMSFSPGQKRTQRPLCKRHKGLCSYSIGSSPRVSAQGSSSY